MTKFDIMLGRLACAILGCLPVCGAARFKLGDGLYEPGRRAAYLLDMAVNILHLRRQLFYQVVAAEVASFGFGKSAADLVKREPDD